MIPIKTRQEIELMQQAGKILASVMDEVSCLIRPGLATLSLDVAAGEAMTRRGVVSAFKGYKGYPAIICVSVNETVVHGIPGPKKLIVGDIVSLDMGICKDGFYVDMAKTFAVGKIQDDKQLLLDVACASLKEAIGAMKPENRLFDISWAVQNHVESRGFSVVKDFVGHGIGRELHEEPQIPNFGQPHSGPVLKDGMVFAIEPMVNSGTWEIEVLEDGWTAVTKDRKPSAHFEHTVAILDGQPVVLTA
ncbi:MAG: type I methionyl aminopeptidase [Candidatus Omnitrophota bacterium]